MNAPFDMEAAARGMLMTSRVEIKTIKPSRTICIGFPHPTERWGFVQDEVARHFECRPDDVGCVQDDEGRDFVTVYGLPVAVVS